MTDVKTSRDVTLKDRTVIPKGSRLTWVGPGDKHPETVGKFYYQGRELKMRYRNVLKVPSMKTLERWVLDGFAEDVIHGSNIEVDGTTSDGSPSWPLALGMV
jgi:hypothetical protein